MDNKTADSAEVEHHEILKRRGIRTRIVHVVPKLYNEAESGQGGPLEKMPIPLLKYVQYQ